MDREGYMAVSKRASRLMWMGVIVLGVIGVAAVTRRTLVLFWPAQFAGRNSPAAAAAALDLGFAKHLALTMVHILPGAIFVVLAPLQFVPGIRAKYLNLHRWMGRVLVVTGLVIGVTALVMSYTMNIGGPNETAATTLFAILFLFSLTKAYRHIRRKEVARHREWMMRAFAIALGVATTRPIVGMFLAFRKVSPHEFFGIAFWLGFTVTFFVAEVWIDYTRYHAVLAGESAQSISERSVAARGMGSGAGGAERDCYHWPGAGAWVGTCSA
jgi:uncharacterized membrane protein